MERIDLDKLDVSLISGSFQSITKHFKNGPGKGKILLLRKSIC